MPTSTITAMLRILCFLSVYTFYCAWMKYRFDFLGLGTSKRFWSLAWWHSARFFSTLTSTFLASLSIGWTLWCMVLVPLSQSFWTLKSWKTFCRHGNTIDWMNNHRNMEEISKKRSWQIWKALQVRAISQENTLFHLFKILFIVSCLPMTCECHQGWYYCQEPT